MSRASLVLTLILCAISGTGAYSAATDLAFEPHPGAQLPLSTGLADEHGRSVVLGSVFGKRPVILVLEYLHCRSLCGITLRDLTVTLRALPLKPGRDFDLVAISIDPRDGPADAAAAAAKYAALYGRADAAGLHFLTGREAEVRKIADRIGFPYRYEARLGTYIHPAGFAIATPGGVVSSYIEGLEATPARLIGALAAAEQEKRIGPLTRILLLCHVEGAPLGHLTVPVLAAFTIANIAAGCSLIALFVAIGRRRHG
ncbi:MAG TPA: SCO family protein [Gemmataceae bacterium]|nr:SCO family protein [Gemmataceae bacterium]